jgi:hypothetical protein
MGVGATLAVVSLRYSLVPRETVLHGGHKCYTIIKTFEFESVGSSDRYFVGIRFIISLLVTGVLLSILTAQFALQKAKKFFFF